MSTAITPFVPENLEQAEKLSTQLAKSALLPEALRGKPGDVLVVLITGSELGLSPMQSVRGLHVIKGKAIMSADLQVALTKRHPDCVYFRMTESTALRATYEAQRKGDPKPTSMTFTMEDAARAGLAGGDTWRKYPAAMLRARCSSSLARTVFPDLMLGVYEEDEEDEARSFGHQPEIDVTPTPEPVVEGLIAAPQDAAAKEVREPPKSSRVAEAKRKAQEAVAKGALSGPAASMPDKPTPAAAPTEPHVEAEPEEVVTPFARMVQLGRLHGLTTPQIFARAQGVCSKTSGWTNDDVEKVATSLAAIPGAAK